MEAIKQFVKERWKPITLFTVLNFFMFYYAYLREDIFHKQYTLLLFILHVLLEIGLIVIYAITKKKQWSIEKIFLAMFIPIGLATVFITPIRQVPDEMSHICRVDAISEGKIIAPKDEKGRYAEPISNTFWYLIIGNQREVYKNIAKGMFTKTSNEETRIDYDGAVSYNPIVYTPQVLGVFLGKTFHLPIIFTMYLGRIFVMLAYAVICYFALKIIPKYKMFMFLIMMLPMTVQQSMAYSGDSMLFAVAFLLIACAFKYTYVKSKDQLTKKQITSIYVLTIILACCKSVVYLPIAFLFFLIPKENFKKPMRKWIHILLALVIASCVSISWSVTQETTLSNPTENTDYVLHNPFEFMVVSIGTALSKDTLEFSKQVFGSSLASYEYESAQIYIIIFLMLAAILVARNTEKLVTKKMHSFLCWAIPIIITGMLFTVAFTQWNGSKPEDYAVVGIQGRYFIAFLPLVPFMLQNKKTKESKNPISLDYVALFTIFSNACVLGAKILHNI